MKASVRKRLLSVLLALTMLVSLCPAAFAEEAEPEEPGAEELFIEEPEQAIEEESAETPALPCGFLGMGEGWELTETELSVKQAVAAHNVAEELAQFTPGVDYVEGEVFFLAESLEYAEQVAAAYNAELKRYEYGVALLQLHEATTLEAVAAGADPALPLPAVEANYIVTLEPDWDVTEPLSSADSGEAAPTLLSWSRWKNEMEQAGLSVDPFIADPLASDYQYQHDVVNSYEAWGVTRGAGVTVAVVDTGTEVAHEDLKNNNTAEPIDVFGLHNQDLNLHGTHVAGIIASEAGNGLGGAGIAPEAGILSVRVLDASGHGGDYDIAVGMRATIEAKKSDPSIKVMNQSLGGAVYSASLEEVIRETVDSGITVVAAMGNDYVNIRCYPAAYDIPGLIAVGSVTRAGDRSFFSDTGTWEDVRAPGSYIMSTVLDNGYDHASGTSMATPVVAGVCALYLSVYPDATPVEVEAAVKAATTNGIVDAAKLFEKDQMPPTIEAEELVAYGGSISIYPGAASDFVVYTTDGSAPAVKDGVVTVGNVLSDGFYEIPVTADNGFEPGKKVTVKALSVSGLGKLSKTVSKSVTVDYQTPTDMVILPVSTVSAGRSVPLSAAVEPAGAKQAALWEIVAKDGCSNTTINPKTGVLSTKGSDSGTVTVMATHPDDDTVTAFAVINIGKPTLTKKLVPDVKKLDELYVSSMGVTGRLVMVSALDAKGKEIEGVVLQWSSSNPKVAAVESFTDNSATVTAVGKGKATVTVKAMDGSSVKATISVEVKQAADEVAVSGPLTIAPGKSAGYKATVTPTQASDKSVVWSLSGAPEGVSIDARTGKLKAAGTVLPGQSFEVIASSKDGYASSSVTVTTQRQLSAIKIRYASGGMDAVTDAKTGALKSAKMFCAAYRDDFSETDEQYDSTLLRLYATDEYNEPVDALWSSSNPKVAVVEADGTVFAVGAGNATVTCTALDSSGKSAKLSVTVANPPSGVTVVSSAPPVISNTCFILGVGRSASNTVVLSDAFGKPTSGKVSWSQRTFAFSDPDIFDAVSKSFMSLSSLEEAVASGKGYEYFGSGITLNNNGLLKTDKTLSALARENIVIVWVNAATTDGSGLSGGVGYVLTNPHTKLALGETSIEVSSDIKWSYDFPIYADGIDWPIAKNYTVQTSDTSIVAAKLAKDDNGELFLRVIIDGHKSGTATITITAVDGSNKSAKLKVKVVEPTHN